VQDNSTTVVQTVACDLGRCGSCRGTVLSLTDAHLTPCAHDCHKPAAGVFERLDASEVGALSAPNPFKVADLPDVWKEQAVLTPPCDGDVVLAEEEIEHLLDLEADRRLEDEWIGAWS
jgi:hypothetical protein